MSDYQDDWCGGLFKVDRKQIYSSVLVFLIQHNPNAPQQRLVHLALSLEESAYTESACPLYYLEQVVANLVQANASVSRASSGVPNATAPKQVSTLGGVATLSNGPAMAALHQATSLEHLPYQQPSPQDDWRNSLSCEKRNKILQGFIARLTSCNMGKSSQAVIEAVTAFESCVFVSAMSSEDYVQQIVVELSRCENCRTLPVPSAQVLSLLQQCGIQPCVPQSQTPQSTVDSVPIPPSPTGPQNILNLEPSELLSSLFEQPNWKDLLTPADRLTVVKHIHSKLMVLNLNETVQEKFQIAISLELDAFTKAETGFTYLKSLKEITTCLQPVCVSEARSTSRPIDGKNSEEVQHITS